MARMHDLYAVMEGIEANMQWVLENSTDGQKRKLNDLCVTVREYGLTPEEAQKFWARKYHKAVYNSTSNRQWREWKKAQRKPTPTGEGWDPEHQLGTVKATTATKKGK